MSITLRAMAREDWGAVAALVHASTNAWYAAQGRAQPFACAPEDVELYCRVYESLDPGCCVLAEDEGGQLLGSCFYHPRPTHMSLGIMNAHPAAFGRGVARQLLDFVIARAAEQGLPLRLVSSAMNLDSYSLYNRRGFVPYAVYQDMLYEVPEQGLDFAPLGRDRVRPATPDDLPAMVALEQEISGIERGRDFAHFLRDEDGVWQVSVLQNPVDSGLDGFLVSVQSAATNMLGPGVMRDAIGAMALICAGLDRFRGRCPVFLVPADRPALTAQLYAMGARNCELHFGQVLGEAEAPRGISMPTFLPETG